MKRTRHGETEMVKPVRQLDRGMDVSQAKRLKEPKVQSSSMRGFHELEIE